jgi:AAA family ATP:ADP antiporter
MHLTYGTFVYDGAVLAQGMRDFLWELPEHGGANWGVIIDAVRGRIFPFFDMLDFLFGLFVGQSVIRKFNWFTAAAITPVIILIGGGLFFAFTCSENLVAPLLVFLKSTPVAVATFLGAGVVIVSKSVKYTLFDPTKEMAYIPLDPELKSKGKAAVDVIGGRAGKAGGGYVQMGLLIAFATKDVVAIAPYAFGTFAVVCIAWLYAVKALSKKVDAAVKFREEERAAA